MIKQRTKAYYKDNRKKEVIRLDLVDRKKP